MRAAFLCVCHGANVSRLNAIRSNGTSGADASRNATAHASFALRNLTLLAVAGHGLKKGRIVNPGCGDPDRCSPDDRCILEDPLWGGADLRDGNLGLAAPRFSAGGRALLRPRQGPRRRAR